MRLAFLCASLEPGRDGVGDYSRRLAGELIRQGHPAAVVGLNDTCVKELVFAQQEVDGIQVPVLRLPAGMSRDNKISEAHRWLEGFAPDWISLQFVPFGFHPRGLCFGLGSMLAAINEKARWHIMFHELWLGLGEKATIKHRVVGLLQRMIILDLAGRLRPRRLHTQAEPYREALRRTNIVASILPLFGNIPRVNGDTDGWNRLLEPLVTQATGASSERSQFYLAGILGMVHPEWDAEKAVDILHPLLQRSQKRLVLVFHGKNTLTSGTVNQLQSKLRNRADVVNVGEKVTPDISRILQTIDLGLATSPRQIIQKSGSVAAMLEHGLSVLVTRDDWRLRGWMAPLDTGMPGLLSPKQFSALRSLPVRNTKLPEESSVKSVTDRLLEALS